jgi:dTDP-4-amino-4,6-dideoxygalactose transaminase
VLVDVDPRCLNIDPTQTCPARSRRVEAAISQRTRAIIPVHIAGLPAEFDTICVIPERRCRCQAVIDDVGLLGSVQV